MPHQQVKLILREDVPNLGQAGDVVTVRPGYARNFLLPTGKAMPATEGRIAEVEHNRRVVAERMERERKAQESQRDRIQSVALAVEMLAGAIKETPAGEIEAAQAAGFSKWNMMFRLVLPSALRRTLPGYSNEVVMMLHATSLASVVPALYDLTNAAYAIYKTYYLAFQPFIVVAVLYFILTFALVYVFRLLEKRFLAYLRPRTH